MTSLDQAWYEKAADVIASSYTSPKERLALLNELWGEYLYEKNRVLPGMGLRIKIDGDQARRAVDDALISEAGLTLQQVIDYAKEITANGTKETQATTASPEQLGRG